MPNLFDSLTLPGGLELRNRLMMAPLTTYSSFDSTSPEHGGGPDGHITPFELAYLERRARGLGLVVTAACYVHKDGKGFLGQWGCDGDDKLPSLRAAATAIRRGGARAFLQLHDAGRQTPVSLIGKPGRAPSSVPTPRDGAETPREMTEADIETALQAFASAAVRAREAGFDGVEIHGANTYLLQQFLSPHSNRREDGWGGDSERRLRFPLEVVLRVRAAVGEDYPVGYRYSPEEPPSWEPGLTSNEGLELVRRLEDFGLAYLSVSTQDYWKGSLRDPEDGEPRARLAKGVTATPVVGVGRVWTASEAAAILADGLDLVALGRSIIVDPEWPDKARRGLEPRRAFPREGWEGLDVPPPLARKILGTPDWFPVGDAGPA